MAHGNKTGMDYTIRLSTKNYELRELELRQRGQNREFNKQVQIYLISS